MDPASHGLVQNIEFRRKRSVGHQLDLYDVLLQIGKRTLQQHLTLVQHAHMVAYVLQLPQIVRRDQNRRFPGGDVL